MKNFLFFVLCTMSTRCAAQDLDPNKKPVSASRAKEIIKIDSELSEASWQSAIATEGFTTLEPSAGEAASKRTKGRYFRTPTSNSLGFFVNSDQRKRLSMRIFGRFQSYGESGRKTRSIELGPAFRVNDHLNFQ